MTCSKQRLSVSLRNADANCPLLLTPPSLCSFEDTTMIFHSPSLSFLISDWLFTPSYYVISELYSSRGECGLASSLYCKHINTKWKLGAHATHSLDTCIPLTAVIPSEVASKNKLNSHDSSMLSLPQQTTDEVIQIIGRIKEGISV